MGLGIANVMMMGNGIVHQISEYQGDKKECYDFFDCHWDGKSIKNPNNTSCGTY